MVLLILFSLLVFVGVVALVVALGVCSGVVGAVAVVIVVVAVGVGGVVVVVVDVAIAVALVVICVGWFAVDAVDWYWCVLCRPWCCCWCGGLIPLVWVLLLCVVVVVVNGIGAATVVGVVVFG